MGSEKQGDGYHKPTQQNGKTVDTWLMCSDEKPEQKIWMESGFGQNSADERGKQRLMGYYVALSKM